MVKQQINVKIFFSNDDVVVAADEAKADSKLQKKLLIMYNQMSTL